jgi:hypothetical protein
MSTTTTMDTHDNDDNGFTSEDWAALGRSRRKAQKSRARSAERRAEATMDDRGVPYEIKGSGVYLVTARDGSRYYFWPKSGKYRAEGTSEVLKSRSGTRGFLCAIRSWS